MAAIDSNTRTLLGLADIAVLADVQRPVVSVWRARSVASDHPFPQPVTAHNSRERFALDDVVTWLETTGRGNNPSIREDAALYAALEIGRPQETVLDGITALLTLKAATGRELSALSPVELLDEADDVDPYDECLYRELDSLGEDLGNIAANADAMANAAYHATAALEHLLVKADARAGLADVARTAVDQVVSDVVARIAAELATSADVHFVDPSGSGDALAALRPAVEDSPFATAALAAGDTTAMRRARRRALAHGWQLRQATDDDGRLALPPGAIVVAQYPSPVEPKISDDAILTAIDEIALAMDDSNAAVVVGPASALVDRPASPEVARARDAVLRTYRVRAAVRLPAGLRPAHPRQRLALWVLGPAQVEVPIAERWLALADVTTPLIAAVIEELVTDVVAATARAAVARAHAFRFARLARAGQVIAAGGDLTEHVRPRVPVVRGGGAQLASTIERRAAEVRVPLAGYELEVDVVARADGSMRVVTLGELVRDRAVHVLSGNRVDPVDLLPEADVRVFGPDQVRGGPPVFLDRLAFSTAYPAGRYTEPGDIVMTTTGRPAALVDDAGLAVVVFPARVLRLVSDAVPGLVPAVVVRAIRAAPEGTPWKSWPIPLAPPEAAESLERQLAGLATAREAARARIAALDDLTDHLSNGVIAGTLTLTTPEKG